MTREQIDAMVAEYEKEMETSLSQWGNSQYDDRSALINYSFIRENKPSVVVEFGTRTGRCTYDILLALTKNGKDFVFKPYELEDDLRREAQANLDKRFGSTAPKIGGDITKAEDIPENIDYLFIDNSHDTKTTKWVFDVLMKKCVKGCLVQIHDWLVVGDFDQKSSGGSGWGEIGYIMELHEKGTLPIEKVYWAHEEDSQRSSSWWKKTT